MSATPHPLDELTLLPPLDASAPLADKLARSRQVLDAVLAALPPAKVAVAYTGGKDSGVALNLWSVALAGLGHGPLRAITVDTGLKFPQVTAFRDTCCDELGVELTLARPLVDLATYPVAQDKLSCCRDLKIKPLHAALHGTDTALIITGIRRDEHPSRAGRPYAELRPAIEGCAGGGEKDCPGHWQVNPILDWTELDIWAFITGQGLPYCELYHQGYRSLGCMPCTSPCEGCVLGDNLGDGAERAGRDQDKEQQLEILKGLGYF